MGPGPSARFRSNVVVLAPPLLRPIQHESKSIENVAAQDKVGRRLAALRDVGNMLAGGFGDLIRAAADPHLLVRDAGRWSGWPPLPLPQLSLPPPAAAPSRVPIVGKDAMSLLLLLSNRLPDVHIYFRREDLTKLLPRNNERFAVSPYVPYNT